MHLMSPCKHYVIANSTFGLWFAVERNRQDLLSAVWVTR